MVITNDPDDIDLDLECDITFPNDSKDVSDSVSSSAKTPSDLTDQEAHEEFMRLYQPEIDALADERAGLG